MKLKEIRVDGYKNLIDCRVPLGDFNVLVGPNNSGKSNLLEIPHVFSLLSCGMGDAVLRGYPGRHVGSSICGLRKYAGRPLTIGWSYETLCQGDTWIVEYDVKVQCDYHDSDKARFLSETLRAKPPSRTGQPTTYLRREGEDLKVMTKTRRMRTYSVAGNASSLSLLDLLSKDAGELPSEFVGFLAGIDVIAGTSVYAILPDALRFTEDTRNGDQHSRVSWFDLLAAIDIVREEEESYDLFKDTVCDVLDLEDLQFRFSEVPIPSGQAEGGEEKVKRARYCFLKTRGRDYASLGGFSDGTLEVVGILAALFSKERKSAITFIEEPENCLHPAAVQKLLRFLQDNADRWPVLLTTHSPYLLNGVDPDDVIVAVVDDDGAAHFEKPRNRRAINERLKSGYMSFGDLMVTNFEEVLEGK